MVKMAEAELQNQRKVAIAAVTVRVCVSVTRPDEVLKWKHIGLLLGLSRFTYTYGIDSSVLAKKHPEKLIN